MARIPLNERRAIRLKDAPAYLGMDEKVFNRDVRPFLTEVPVGGRGVGFDRLDLDAWWEQHKSRNGRPGKGGTAWDERQDSGSVTACGTSTSASGKPEFEAAVARATDGKPKKNSRAA